MRRGVCGRITKSHPREYYTSREGPASQAQRDTFNHATSGPNYYDANQRPARFLAARAPKFGGKIRIAGPRVSQFARSPSRGSSMMPCSNKADRNGGAEGGLPRRESYPRKLLTDRYVAIWWVQRPNSRKPQLCLYTLRALRPKPLGSSTLRCPTSRYPFVTLQHEIKMRHRVYRRVAPPHLRVYHISLGGLASRVQKDILTPASSGSNRYDTTQRPARFLAARAPKLRGSAS